MPLPKQQTDWVGRIVVLLVLCAAIGCVLPLTWLLRVLHAPDWVAYPALTVWVMLVPLSALWAITVWAPVRGKKLAELVLKTPWFLG